jgi:hypothetical protein
VALPCGQQARYSQSAFSMASLELPPGTRLSMATGLSIPRSLNTIIREMSGDWVWFQADDHVFDSGLLMRLLDKDVDVVVPLIVRHIPPFAPVIFKQQTDIGYEPFAYDEIPAGGLFEVHAAGTGGMLVRRHVLDAVGEPWFEFSSHEVHNEDLEFCRKIRHAGFQIYADADNIMGHMGVFTIWPDRDESGVGFKLDFGESTAGAMNEIRVRSPREPVAA